MRCSLFSITAVLLHLNIALAPPPRLTGRSLYVSRRITCCGMLLVLLTSAAFSSWSRQVVMLRTLARTCSRVRQQSVSCWVQSIKYCPYFCTGRRLLARFVLVFLNFGSQRLHIGSIKEGSRRPTTLLSHADVVAALHRCKYDPASAEASLIALARRREANYKVASAGSDARNSEQGNTEQAAGVGVTGEAAGSAAADKSTSMASPKVLCDAPPGGKSDIGGNRWEDWSEDDRAAFLAQLGDKVRRCTACCFLRSGILRVFFPHLAFFMCAVGV